MIASAESKKILVRAQAISKNYTMAKGELTVLKNISIDIHEGEFIVILGPSGAGKSTLLHILGILDKPSSGDVFFENTQVSQLSDVAMARLRNARVGFVFQFHYLLPEFTALENVIMPALIAGKPSNDPSSYERGKDLLKNVGLAERYYHRPSELSGGE
ncbi:MAG TPA: ATP-binding cassette domain-containing protein, partial [bacterium]|nr:ATP-binding cassette domain-containing protein [bacterium]